MTLNPHPPTPPPLHLPPQGGDRGDGAGKDAVGGGCGAGEASGRDGLREGGVTVTGSPPPPSDTDLLRAFFWFYTLHLPLVAPVPSGTQVLAKHAFFCFCPLHLPLVASVPSRRSIYWLYWYKSTSKASVFLLLSTASALVAPVATTGAQFTCFNSTKVLALLVQKYKYWRKSVSHARQLLFRRCLLRQYLYFCTSKIR